MREYHERRRKWKRKARPRKPMRTYGRCHECKELASLRRQDWLCSKCERKADKLSRKEERRQARIDKFHRKLGVERRHFVRREPKAVRPRKRLTDRPGDFEQRLLKFTEKKADKLSRKEKTQDK